jgi:hypothetical protein
VEQSVWGGDTMFFFMGMAVLCAWLGAQLRDRWLWVNAVLFVGLAGTPYLAGVALWGWWLAVGLTAFWAARQRSEALPRAASTDSMRPLRSL